MLMHHNMKALALFRSLLLRKNLHQWNSINSRTALKCFSTSLVNHSSNRKENSSDLDYQLIYEGPLSRKIRMLKLFSLSTAGLSVVCAPIFIFFGKQSVPFFAKAVMGGTVFVMGVTTTMVLHWLTKVYVHKMYFNPHKKEFYAEIVSLFGRYKKHFFHASDVYIPEIESAFSTFEANGNKYFIHMDLKEAETIMKYVKDFNYENL